MEYRISNMFFDEKECKNLINIVGSLPIVSLFRSKFLSNLSAIREFQFAITLFLTEDRSSILITKYSRINLNHL